MGKGMRVVARATGANATNTTVTNIPGPQEPLYLAGSRMVTQFTLGTLLEGMGIFHAVQSYCGQLALTVVADRDKLPDPTFYGECMDRAFEELKAGAGGQAPEAGKPARRKRVAVS
jgi:diacylglycerol O-acyltransferase / wax synthase